MTERTWRSALTRAEIEDLLRVRDVRGWVSLALDWGLIFAAMAVVAAFPNVFTVIAALLVIGARQLGLAVLMHEAAHRTLFRSRALNDWAGTWLCGHPIWADIERYRPEHLRHHAKTQTDEDPDLWLANRHPVTPSSMARKVWRDLSGQVAWKRIKLLLRIDAQNARAGRGRPLLRGVLLTNGILFGLLLAVGHPALYALWVGAWLSTYSLVTRIRSIAEHSMVPDRAHELKNTRTTLARWWERLLIAPNRVNYHLEHHLLMTVPHYNLPRLHRLLRERGALDGALVERGYWGILRRAAAGSGS